jgi:hypothetical protein
MLSVTNTTIMHNVVMPSVAMLNVVMLNVVDISVLLREWLVVKNIYIFSQNEVPENLTLIDYQYLYANGIPGVYIMVNKKR